MQARRKKRYHWTKQKRTARPGAAGRRKGRLAALLCGLLLCAGAALALRACAGPEAPAGCSLERPVPQEDAVFPVGTSGWNVSSGYGWRTDPFAENSPADAEDFHRGVDLACAEGTPVLAAMDGVVLAAGRSASYGNYIRLCHADGVETLYAHLQYLFARPGEVVRAGQVMGTAGQTGRATGPPLPFALLDRAVRRDPSALLGLPA